MNTFESLQDRGAYWQTLLGLDQWDIRFAFAAPHELGDAWADCDFDQYSRTALVRVLDPQFAHLQAFPAPPYDIDYSLVHEMVHLLLDPLGVNEPEDAITETLLEQTINSITDIVVALENK